MYAAECQYKGVIIIIAAADASCSLPLATL